MSQTFEKTFSVTPRGIYGMDQLASFLNRLKTAGAIADWHPGSAVSGSKGAHYAVVFDSEKDGAHATAQWALPS